MASSSSIVRLDSIRDGSSYVRGEPLLKAYEVTRYVYFHSRTKKQEWESQQSRKVKSMNAAAQLAGQRYQAPPAETPPTGSTADEILPGCISLVRTDPSTRDLKWAPHDALDHPSATLAEWKSHGYGSYQLHLSLIGTDAYDKSDQAKQLRRENKFVRSGYSYVHMSFERFVEILRKLNPVDRFFCYMIPHDVPVHMYFDIDGKFSEFPDLIDRDEAVLNEFLQEVRVLFLDLFGREMDCSGLTLLQATSATKLSWHIHVQTEAFICIDHVKRFVIRLNEKIKCKSESAVETLLYRNSKSLVDPMPYMKNQNLRLVYCRKPGKMALLPRAFYQEELNRTGRIMLKPASSATELHANIDEELLWRCHPALAQPGPGYTHLALNNCKRKSASGGSSQNQSRRMALTTDAASGGCKERSNHRLEDQGYAVLNSSRSLSTEEEELVKSALVPHLGPFVQLDSCTWYQSKHDNQSVVIRGVCSAGSAYCITQTNITLANASSPIIHSRNRMAFSLSGASSCISLRCFKCDAGKNGHKFQWNMSEEECTMMMCAFDNPMRSVASAVVVNSIDDSAAPMEIIDDESESELITNSAAIEVDAVESEISESSDHSLRNRLIACIRKATERPPVKMASIFENVKASGIDSTSTQKRELFDLFKEVVFNDETNPNHSHSGGEMFQLFCDYNQKLEEYKKNQPLKWKQVMTITERFLDPSELCDLFDRETHLAVHAGQGTGKTALLLVMLLILILRKPTTRAIIISNRKTFANTTRERCAQFDREIASTFGVQLGFRAYTEEEFRPPNRRRSDRLAVRRAVETGQEESKESKKLRNEAIDQSVNKANRRLVAVPRLIISLESLGRIFSATTEHGVPIVPQYDVIIPDEFMELLGIFHGSTMKGKRRTALQHWTCLMTAAQHVWAADAGFRDESALLMLKWLTGGKSFVKLHNTAKTLTRTYRQYPKLAQSRMNLITDLKAGKNVYVACNSRNQAESIINDPEIVALNIPMKALHSGSGSSDRKNFVDTVDKWNELQLLVTSPLISHGVNFDKPHFHVAYLFASNHSTTYVQTFQQLNRVRQLQDNEVHLFIDAQPKMYQHLICDRDRMKADLNEEIRKYHGEFFLKNIRSGFYDHPNSTSIDLPVKTQHGSLPPDINGQRPSRSDQTDYYILDERINPVTCTRQLFDSPGNELFLLNQLHINESRVNYERGLIREIEDAGGVVLTVSLKATDIPAIVQHSKEILKADQLRKEVQLATILNAPDIASEVELEVIKLREKYHDLETPEMNQLEKAEWKKTYGIPLDDITRLHAIENFPSRFGTVKRLQQFNNLKQLTEIPKRVEVTDTSDPIGYLAKESALREHVKLLLESVGFSPSLWDESIVVVSVQVEKMSIDSVFRKSIVQRWEKTPIKYQARWNEWKKNHKWKVQADNEVYDSEGSAVESKKLFKCFLTICRQFLLSHLEIKIATGQLGRAESPNRGYIHQLDRTHWNDVMQSALQLLPQELSERVAKKVTHKRLQKVSLNNVILSEDLEATIPTAVVEPNSIVQTKFDQLALVPGIIQVPEAERDIEEIEAVAIAPEPVVVLDYWSEGDLLAGFRLAMERRMKEIREIMKRNENSSPI